MKIYNHKKFKVFRFLDILVISIICISFLLYINFNHNFNYMSNTVSDIYSKINLNTYKFWYVNYKRIFKSRLKTRFSAKELEMAIVNAKSQPWVKEQIEEDLKPFAKVGLSSKDIDQLYENLSSNLSWKYHLVKFKITNHKLKVDYVDEVITGFRSYKTIYDVINILNELRLISDCTFIVYLNDYLDHIPDNIKDPIPIFSFAKDTKIPVEKSVILIPDWMNIYYWDILKGRIDNAKKIYLWSKKAPLIHWRGGKADSAIHRAKLIELRDKVPFLEIGFTEGNNKVPFLHPEFSLNYKYQLALDGARCTWERVVWQMYSNCLMIKPKSTQVQWFYRGLKANYNYFYLEDISRSDLVEGYKWLLNNDIKVQAIIRNANDFAKKILKPKIFLLIMCCCYKNMLS